MSNEDGHEARLLNVIVENWIIKHRESLEHIADRRHVIDKNKFTSDYTALIKRQIIKHFNRTDGQDFEEYVTNLMLDRTKKLDRIIHRTNKRR